MSVSYNKLWKTLIDKGMNKTELRQKAHISSSTMAKMTNGEAVTLTTIERICDILDCQVEDVVEIKKEKKESDIQASER